MLRLLLHLVRCLFLVGDLAFREDLYQCLGQDHVLDVYAAGLHFVLTQLHADVLQRAFLHLLSGFDELDCRHALQFIAEMIAYRRLQHFVDQVADRAHHADYARGRGIGHVDLHDQFDHEHEAFPALCLDLR